MPYAITTSRNAPTRTRERATEIAESCAAPWIDRTSTLERVFESAGVEILYVASPAGDTLLHRSGERIRVSEGMLSARLHAGNQHPLIRAVAPEGRCGSIVDGTLGLAQDALHLAAALTCPVIGIEASPPVLALVRDGLERLSHSSAPVGPAAARITPRAGHAADVLERLGRDATDVVFLSPMFSKPRRAPAGYAVFRAVALHAPLGHATIDAAVNAARHRVVLKLERHESTPSYWPGSSTTVLGRAVRYEVLETAGVDMS